MSDFPPAMRWLLGITLVGTTLAASEESDGARLLHQQRYAEAQVAFERQLEANPRDGEVLRQLGRLALMRNEPKAAAEYLRQAVEQLPDQAEGWFDLGRAQLRRAEQLGAGWRALGPLRDGRAALEQAVAREPRDVRYRQALFEFHRRAPRIAGGSKRRAHEEADAIFRLDAVQGTFALAAIDEDAGEPLRGLHRWRALTEDAQSRSTALFEIGRIAATHDVAKEEGLKALEELLRTRAEPPADRPETALHLARLYRQTGRVEEATTCLTNALARHPDHPSLLAERDRLQQVNP